MEELFTRIYENMLDRVSGPMYLRLYLQPVMAAVFAIISGFKDAKTGRPPYFWALFTQPGHRREMLKDGWKSVGKVFLAAMAIDVVYQLIVERWIYPLEVVLVAFILAIVPYLTLRGFVNRLVCLRSRQGGQAARQA
jgi:hypothetical protein